LAFFSNMYKSLKAYEEDGSLGNTIFE